MALHLVSDSTAAPAATDMMRRARERRREALLAHARCIVTTTRNGHVTEEHVFDSVPTLSALVERAGATAFVVSVRMERAPARGVPGLAYAMAAE